MALNEYGGVGAVDVARSSFPARPTTDMHVIAKPLDHLSDKVLYVRVGMEVNTNIGWLVQNRPSHPIGGKEEAFVPFR